MSDSVREAFERDIQKIMPTAPLQRLCSGYADLTIDGAWQGYQAATAAADAEWRGVVEKLVEALKIAQEAAECFPDVHDGRVEPLQIIEHLHEWEAKYITFGQVVGADQALAQAEKLMGRKQCSELR